MVSLALLQLVPLSILLAVDAGSQRKTLLQAPREGHGAALSFVISQPHDVTDVTSRDVIATDVGRYNNDNDNFGGSRNIPKVGRNLFFVFLRRKSRSDRDAPHCRAVCRLCERVVRRATSSLCWKECGHHGIHFQVCLAVRTLWEHDPDDGIFLRPH